MSEKSVCGPSVCDKWVLQIGDLKPQNKHTPNCGLFFFVEAQMCAFFQFFFLGEGPI